MAAFYLIAALAMCVWTYTLLPSSKAYVNNRASSHLPLLGGNLLPFVSWRIVPPSFFERKFIVRSGKKTLQTQARRGQCAKSHGHHGTNFLALP